MNSRERVLSTLDHKEGDRIPLDLGAGKSCKMHAVFYKKLLDHLGIREEAVIGAKVGQLAIASDAVLEKLQCDVRTPFPLFLKNQAAENEQWEDGEYKYFRDDWGTVMRMPKNAPLYYDMHRPPLKGTGEEADSAYVWPEPAKVDPAAVEQAKRYRAIGYPVTITEHFGNGFLQNGPKLFGFDDWLMMLSLEEDRVRACMEKLLERKMQYFDNLLAAFGDLVDVVSECEDLGTQNAPFISPDMFRNLIKPYWARLFAHIRSKTKAKILLHSCGAIEPLIGDLIDIGVDALNPVQISANGMDPFHLKKEYGKDITFWGGGIDTQKILPLGTRDQVRDHVKRNIEALSRDGGFIFATVHNTQADVPVDNFMTMWETFMECRDY